MNQIVQRFKEIAPNVDFWSLRLSDSQHHRIGVRQNITTPIQCRQTTGAFLSVIAGNGIGYAATSDLSKAGLVQIIEKAVGWAKASTDLHLLKTDQIARARISGTSSSPVQKTWDSMSLSTKLELLNDINNQLKIHDNIVDWWASLSYTESDQILLTPDAEISKRFNCLVPSLCAVAHKNGETQARSYGVEYTAQAGLEHLQRIGFQDNARRVAEESLQLLDAPNCPSGQMDLLLKPSQMALQIHESIGHPLELDRILGDERNYAGTSFVTLDMFGHYQYGSPLLNVTYDPSLPYQIASYRFDDEGTSSEHLHLIKNGVLVRPLGCKTSQNRANTSGVANSRACDWNRPPIDRMANLNLEPGESSFQQMQEDIEQGVLMDTNRSWSIDDSRNKFQFGCELGRLIENGEIKGLVKNPNYRGISANFWRNLKRVGDRSTFDVMGVPTCGKGEPNQAIQVGHASPACVFENVTVFGGN